MKKAVLTLFSVFNLFFATIGHSEVDQKAEFMEINVFSLGFVGFAGHISSQERLYRRIRQAPDSKAYFNKVLRSNDATIESKMYAMCGLRDIDYPSFLKHKEYFSSSSTVSTLKGDILSKEKVVDVLYRIEKFGCQ